MGELNLSENQVVDDARILLQDRHRIRLELYGADYFGITIPALRPEEPAGVPLFAVAIQATPLGVMATLMPDSYAGNIVRLLGESAQADPELWVTPVADGAANAIQTSIYVNNNLVEVDRLPDTRWHNLEIECRSRIYQNVDMNQRVGVVAGTAGLCLALCLLGLDTEGFRDPAESAPEGARMTVVANRYERSPRNRRLCINHYGHSCWVCDLVFSDTYGLLGDGYIEVHHMVPVAEMGAGYRPDPVLEMVPLCSNCHSMIHRGKTLLSPVELRGLMGKDPKGNPWNGQTFIG